MKPLLLTILIFSVSACAQSRKVMKDCEPVSGPFWVCVEQ